MVVSGRCQIQERGVKDKLESLMVVIFLAVTLYLFYAFFGQIINWGFADKPGFDHAGPTDSL